MFKDQVIDSQGKEEHILLINEMKKEILGNDKVKETELNTDGKAPMYSILQSQCMKWQQLIDKMQWYQPSSLPKTKEMHWYHMLKRLKQQIKVIIHTIHQVGHEEWLNSKMHLIRIGKYGQIARMVSPKACTGPTAGSHYPIKFGEPPRKAINDNERKEACLQTHELWISNPPGVKDCHFIDIIEDDVDPHGVNINPDKVFDDDAEWNYLGALLSTKVNEEIAEKIKNAHQNSLYSSNTSKQMQI
jgi:hypothetical protein